VGFFSKPRLFTGGYIFCTGDGRQVLAVVQKLSWSVQKSNKNRTNGSMRSARVTWSSPADKLKYCHSVSGTLCSVAWRRSKQSPSLRARALLGSDVTTGVGLDCWRAHGGWEDQRCQEKGGDMWRLAARFALCKGLGNFRNAPCVCLKQLVHMQSYSRSSRRNLPSNWDGSATCTAVAELAPGVTRTKPFP
jgi:hypothetical protein